MAPPVLCLDDRLAGSLDGNANDMRIARATNIVITDPAVVRVSVPSNTVSMTVD